MSEKMNISIALLPYSSEEDGNFIDGDSFEDGCSICLEPFISLDPAFVTKCEHQYHLQCILEWSQRSSQCPVCLQHLVLNDPNSPELIATAEREKTLNPPPPYQENEHSPGDHDCLTMRHVAAIGARMITRRRRHIDSRSRSRSTEFAAMSDSLKAKLTTASVRYRESLSKGTRSFKKFMAGNDSVKELSRGVRHEMSAGIAGISRLIARKRAELCVPLQYRRVEEEDSVVETLSPATRDMSSSQRLMQ